MMRPFVKSEEEMLKRGVEEGLRSLQNLYKLVNN
jgi:hypothetical protein